MKHWLFIFSNYNQEMIHVGISSDMQRTLQFYHAIPQPKEQRRYILVWCCEFKGLDEAQTSYQKLMSFSTEKKKAVIQKSNPNFIELIPNKNLQI